jgi:hypothetical protein
MHQVANRGNSAMNDGELDNIGTLMSSTWAMSSSGRVRLRELAGQISFPSHRQHTPELVHYAQLFSARDWEGVRAMLARDVKLGLDGAGIS